MRLVLLGASTFWIRPSIGFGSLYQRGRQSQAAQRSSSPGEPRCACGPRCRARPPGSWTARLADSTKTHSYMYAYIMYIHTQYSTHVLYMCIYINIYIYIYVTFFMHLCICVSIWNFYVRLYSLPMHVYVYGYVYMVLRRI